MKDRFYMGKASDGQFVINPNDLEASPVSLVGRVVGQTQENVPIRKQGYFVVNGQLRWLSNAMLERQRTRARAIKATYQGIGDFRSLRGQFE
ncbi:hypothetical protein HYV88_02835 [Candidatus Woesearchaeota archaeon]|nr:hypothetical protein [Candidatus Woesearchaeota archaeon]